MSEGEQGAGGAEEEQGIEATRASHVTGPQAPSAPRRAGARARGDEETLPATPLPGEGRSAVSGSVPVEPVSSEESLGHTMPASRIAPEDDPGGLATAHASPGAASREERRSAIEVARAGREERRKRGASFGRYILLELLGTGAMGEVYSAYDPELDRRIALKVMSESLEQLHLSTQAKGRLVREAKAMARLAHPNVIPVYDVGTVEGDVYIAMELVQGQPLRDWQRGRPWQEVFEAHLQAGRGLAHAHAAGVVHRDYKPDNVLVGDDGRVRVIDFGIAQRGDEEAHTDPEIVESADRRLANLEDAARTMPGHMMGTPAYMAPEQFSGSSDARSDQFAFAISLYEGLYGQRPFSGKKVLELAHAITREAPRPPPEESKVPPRLFSALLRGLEKEPEARYPDMDALLDALQPVPPPARRRLWALALLALALPAVAIYALSRPEVVAPAPCRGMERHLTGVWGEAERAAVRRAIAAAELAYGAQVEERVLGQLDARAEAWVAMRTEACEATAVRREQSEEALALRMSCLDRRLREQEAAAHLLTEADAEIMERASQIVSDLTSVDRCADLDRLAAEAANEPPPALRDRVIAARDRLTQARTLHEAGRYEPALEETEAALREASRIGFLPLTAEAYALRGRTRTSLGQGPEARDDYFEAIRLADEGGDAYTEAEGWIGLVFVTSDRLNEYTEAERWSRFAESAVSRAGDDPELRARLLANEAVLSHRVGRLEEALARQTESLAIERARLGEEHWRVGAAYESRASVLSLLGRQEEAIAEHRRALAVSERALGEDHPRLSAILGNLGNALRRSGRLEEARAAYERALENKRRNLGDHHPTLAYPLIGLGNIERRLGRYEAARGYFERAREVRREALGETHAMTVNCVIHLAYVTIDEGRAEEALAPLREVLALHLTQDHDTTAARTRIDLSYALLVAGRTEEARAEAAASLLALKNAEVSALILASPQTLRGYAEVLLGQPEQAIEPLERALATRVEAQVDPEDLALTRLALGRALVESGRDPARGRGLIEHAVNGFREAGPTGHWGLQQAEAWIASHPPNE